MKKNLFTLLVIYTFSTQAQEIKITLSDKFKLPEHGDAFKAGNSYYALEMDLSGAQLGYVATLKGSSHGIELHKYDLNMKEVKDVKLEDGKKNFGPFSSRFLTFGNKLLLLYFRYSEDTVKLFLSEVDPEMLSLANTKLLFIVPQKGSINPIGLNKGLNTIFSCETPDRAKLLIAYANDKQILSCIIDKEMHLSRASHFTTPARYFALESVFIDSKENKYFSYELGDKEFMGDILSSKRGILMENNSGKELFQAFNAGEGLGTKRLDFKNSLDNTKTYVYANYYAKNLMEGVVLATLDPANLKINRPELISYSVELRDKLHKLSFAEKKKDGTSVYETDFDLVDNGQGTLALIGQCSYVNSGVSALSGRGYSVANVGPIIGVFIHGEDINFTLIPRKEIMPGKAQVTAVLHKNNITCIYTDNERYVNDETIENKKKGSLKTVFATATFDSDGLITAQKQLADYPTGDKTVFLRAGQKITDGHYLIPVLSTSAGMTRYRTHIVQWADLRLE